VGDRLTMLLFAGCSYTDNPYFPRIAFGENVYRHTHCKILARGGVGNTFIARSILDNLIPEVDKVFVLWSGFSRIDISVPRHMEYQFDPYEVRSLTNDASWLHSGGFGGSWHSRSRYRYAQWIYDCIAAQYKPMDWNYLATQNLVAISGCLNTLDKLGIKYKFGFIYDIFQDYSDDNTSLSGPVSRTHPLLRLIPWEHCLSSSPFEFCRDRGLLDSTEPTPFHPSQIGYQEWWNSVKHEVPFELI
jgi:hypothetical protein